MKRKQHILYMPIIQPGVYHDAALANKGGLRDALAEHGEVRQWDYLAHQPRGDVRPALAAHLNDFQPDLVFTQLQGTDVLNAGDIRRLREEHPNALFLNWNGDAWPEHLIAPDMLALTREFDIQLVVNGGVLPTYAREGVNAAFWPFGFEPVDALPKMPTYDVVYLGNNYSEGRAQLYDVLRSLNATVGIYGSGWPQSEGDTNYDFASGAALYANAKLTISDAQWPDADGYLSNRPFEALAAGTLVLQQRVRNLGEMTGLKAGVHFIDFEHLDELPALVKFWLAKGQDRDRKAIAAAGKRYVRHYHSWSARVKKLLGELLP